MRNFVIGSLLAVGITVSGCADNEFEATIDGEVQEFDEVEVAIREAGTMYQLTATGTQEDGAQLTLHASFSADAVQATETGKELTINGTSSFKPGSIAADLAAEVSYAADAAQEAPVVAVWVEAKCDACTRKGDEKQLMKGTLILDDVEEDHLSGTIRLDMSGAIPRWRTAGSVSATLELSFDSDISR